MLLIILVLSHRRAHLNCLFGETARKINRGLLDTHLPPRACRGEARCVTPCLPPRNVNSRMGARTFQEEARVRSQWCGKRIGKGLLQNWARQGHCM